MSGIGTLSEFFKANMQQIFMSIIIPNISLTEDDIEEYQDEPDKYI